MNEKYFNFTHEKIIYWPIKYQFALCSLPKKEQDRVEEILAKSLRKERGEPIEEIITVGDDEESDEGIQIRLQTTSSQQP